MSKINALLVDPYRKELRHIEIENSISVWHQLLQCTCCDVRRIMQAPWGSAVDVWFDDDFLNTHEQLEPSFRFLPDENRPNPLSLSGYALVCGRDTHGASVSLSDEGFIQKAHVIQNMLRLEFENWHKRLKTDDYINQLMRTPETEPGLRGCFRYLDIPEESGKVRVS